MGNFGKLLETLGNVWKLLGESRELLGNLKRLLWLGEPRGYFGPKEFLGDFDKATLEVE